MAFQSWSAAGQPEKVKFHALKKSTFGSTKQRKPHIALEKKKLRKHKRTQFTYPKKRWKKIPNFLLFPPPLKKLRFKNESFAPSARFGIKTNRVLFIFSQISILNCSKPINRSQTNSCSNRDLLPRRNW